MKERPILFSAPMVRALLEGRKTQTRRIVKYQRGDDCFVMLDWGDGWWPYSSTDGESANVDGMEYPYKSPYGQPGDRLWVRETHCLQNRYQNVWCTYVADGTRMAVPAPELVNITRPGNRPSIFMPRWASRINLEITSVRVERLQDISEADAIAEGIYLFPGEGGGYKFDRGEQEYDTAIEAYRDLWTSINGSWVPETWVWVVEFRRLEEKLNGGS